MGTNSNENRFASVRRHGLLRASIGLAIALMATGYGGDVCAQSITGGLYGREPAGANLVIVVTSQATGFKRELKTDAQGRYRTAGLNPGNYQVTVQKDGKPVGERTVRVKPDVQTPVPALTATVAGATVATATHELGAVVVSGNAAATQTVQIDVSTPELTSHYSKELTDDLPLPGAASPESIALLRSNVRYDDNNTGLVQLAGASPAENRYYLNEFDTTNDRTSLGSNRLPREAIQDTQVIAGNFGASWTNATGGIMAQTIRQGTNDFAAGYSLYLTPGTSRLLNPRAHNVYRASDGTLVGYNSQNHHDWSATQYFWGSGTIIRDRLFAFVLLGNNPPTKSFSYNYYNQRASVSSVRQKNALVNLTWNIMDGMTFNLAGSRIWGLTSTNTWQTTAPGSTAFNKWLGYSRNPNRQRFLIGNYNWHINDDLDLRVMGGHLGQPTYRGSVDDTVPYVTSCADKTGICNNIGNNIKEKGFKPDDYWRTGYKADLTWHVGDHKLVFGAEHYKHFLSESWGYPLAGDYTYHDLGNGPILLPNGSTVSAPYVEQQFNREGGRMISVNKGAYIEDYWQATDRLVLYGGVRFDRYIQKDAIERPMFNFPVVSPRLGVSWDVNGDSSLKVGANLGRYSLSMPSNFSFGLGESNETWQQYYYYTGIDPVTKAPTGLTPIGGRIQQPGKDGIPPSVDQVAATNLKAPMEDMAQIYVQKQLGRNWIGQVDIGVNNLKRVINETCDYTLIESWAHSHGYPNYSDPQYCFEINPGNPITVVRDFAGNGTKTAMTIPSSALGLAAPRHKYYHLTLDLNHVRTADEPWYLGLSYTWTHSYGNTSGYLDLSRQGGYGQGYIGQQDLWDFPQQMLGASGNLPNDIRHSFTASGVYYFANGLRPSFTLAVHSGEPLSCFGFIPQTIPGDAYLQDYGYYYGDSYFCNGKMVTQGSAGRLPWYVQLNVGLGYDMKFGNHSKLSLDIDIQNVTNHRGVINRYQYHDANIAADGSIIVDPNYGQASYQAPRTTYLVLRYTY